jgi:hypothetical protein
MDTDSREFMITRPAPEWRRRDVLTAGVPFTSESARDFLQGGQQSGPVAPQLRAQRLTWAVARLELPEAAIVIDPGRERCLTRLLRQRPGRLQRFRSPPPSTTPPRWGISSIQRVAADRHPRGWLNYEVLSRGRNNRGDRGEVNYERSKLPTSKSASSAKTIRPFECVGSSSHGLRHTSAALALAHRCGS